MTTRRGKVDPQTRCPTKLNSGAFNYRGAQNGDFHPKIQ
jgi:hypothetical protein